MNPCTLIARGYWLQCSPGKIANYMHYYAQIAYPYYIPVYWGFDLFEQNTLANLD